MICIKFEPIVMPRSACYAQNNAEARQRVGGQSAHNALLVWDTGDGSPQNAGLGMGDIRNSYSYRIFDIIMIIPFGWFLYTFCVKLE